MKAVSCLKTAALLIYILTSPVSAEYLGKSKVQDSAQTSEVPPTTAKIDVTEENFITSAEGVTSTLSPAYPLADLQVIDGHGNIVDKVSTSQQIRLRVQALTSPAFQSPFVKTCWYTELSEPSDTKDDNSVMFIERGCKKSFSKILLDTKPFSENGILDKRTNLFDLMPLFNEDFLVLKFQCEVYLCHADAVCAVTCPALKTNMWSIEDNAEKVMVERLVAVEKKKPTTPAPLLKESGIIRGGKGYIPEKPKPEEPFLKKYQHYFVIVILSITVLLLVCAFTMGFIYISQKNKQENEIYLKSNMAANNKLTGYPDVIGNPNMNATRIRTSPPPAYTNTSVWTTPPRKLSTSGAGLLQLRAFPRTTPGTRQTPEQRRLDWDTVPIGEAQDRSTEWNEIADRDRVMMSSPVGGELYHGPSGKLRSSYHVQDEMAESSNLHARDRVPLVRAALREYFEKYGM